MIIPKMAFKPMLSVIVVFHNMAREAPRTLFTLSAEYQFGVCPGDYEVIVVDAGSSAPLEQSFVKSFGENFKLVRSPAAPSPVGAINWAATLAQGDAIALCIDGARMLSPGILRLMFDAFTIRPDPLVATLAWHLGPKIQNESLLEGYDQMVEDQLLDSVDWRRDGYELFRISSLAASSKDCWFCPIGESNCLAVRRETWRRLGGLHEGFVSPGGGLVIRVKLSY
jgi:glycosyltransferase involved in cell wall biosynthesis